MPFFSEVLDAVAVVVACLSSLLKLSTELSVSQFRSIVSTNQNLAAGLAKSVECSTAERKVARSRGQTNTQGLKITEK